MVSTLARSGGGGTTSSPPSPEGDSYECDCQGFQQHMIEYMCIRCLAVYAEALPQVLQGVRLTREMRRVASVLARRVKDDPLLGNLPFRAVLRIANGEPE
jgi:hypothetical protein